MLDPRPAAAGALVLDEVLDLKAAAPLHRALLARRGEPLEVDASAVRRLGGLCLQVLLSAVDAWAADDRPFALVNPSPAFLEGFDLLGVAHAA